MQNIVLRGVLKSFWEGVERFSQKFKEYRVNEKNEDVMNFRKNRKYKKIIFGLVVNNIYGVIIKYSIWNYLNSVLF